jgi:hypothetical protein
MDLWEKWWDVAEWIDLAQGRDQALLLSAFCSCCVSVLILGVMSGMGRRTLKGGISRRRGVFPSLYVS